VGTREPHLPLSGPGSDARPARGAGLQHAQVRCRSCESCCTYMCVEGVSGVVCVCLCMSMWRRGVGSDRHGFKAGQAGWPNPLRPQHTRLHILTQTAHTTTTPTTHKNNNTQYTGSGRSTPSWSSSSSAPPRSSSPKTPSSRVLPAGRPRGSSRTLARRPRRSRRLWKGGSRGRVRVSVLVCVYWGRGGHAGLVGMIRPLVRPNPSNLYIHTHTHYHHKTKPNPTEPKPGLVKSQLGGRVMDRYLLSLLTKNGTTVQPFLRVRKPLSAAAAALVRVCVLTCQALACLWLPSLARAHHIPPPPIIESQTPTACTLVYTHREEEEGSAPRRHPQQPQQPQQQ
jgi:hypothetical protein